MRPRLQWQHNAGKSCPLALLGLSLAACEPHRSRDRLPGITQEEARRAALAEGRRRRGEEPTVRYCRIEGDHWLVALEGRDPSELGSFCWVEVSTNGAVLAYHGGR